MTPVQTYAQDTIAYLEQDLASFEAVLKDSSLPGKLGVAMITNATAALDLFAWLLYQRLDQKTSNRDLFKKMISDTRFFSPNTFVNEKVLYALVRCGVVHQFYPKNISIVALDRNETFLQRNGQAYVNAVGFYRKTLEGLRLVRDHIISLSGDELNELDFKLELRRRLDEAELDGASLTVSNLPIF